MKRFLLDVRDAGFSGVQNFPTVGLFDGTFRANLEETGMGYGKEVDMIALAHELDLLTCPYVFTPEEADADGEGRRGRAHPAHGPDHQGQHRREDARSRWTQSAKRVQELADAAKKVKPDILVLCHGGPISEPADVRVHPRPHQGHRRLLRRVEHRTAADRGRHHRLREAVQGIGAEVTIPRKARSGK